MRNPFLALLLALSPTLSIAQIPATPSGLTTVRSKADSTVTISFKENEICAGEKGYSGYVHLPRSSLEDVGGYDINTFFLYLEARHNPATAPLVIYLAGGPGESTSYAAFDGELGPCYANVAGNDTIKSKRSYNEYANVLYIDQPVQAGFSYDRLVNATVGVGGLVITPLKEGEPLPKVIKTRGVGFFPSQEFKHTAHTTGQAAQILWHFAENWLTSFPGYRTSSGKIGLWGNSYGGYWVPETAFQFSKGLRALPTHHPLAHRKIVVDNIGFTNGCMDVMTQAAGWPDMAYNNTYDTHYATKSQYEAALLNITKPNGLNDLV